MGAETLLGHGDMLYLPPGTAVPERVHGAFVDDHEVHRVVGALEGTGPPNTSRRARGSAAARPACLARTGLPEGGDRRTASRIELYDQAVRIVTQNRGASISGVQRRLKIGYNRAARLIETMEAAGLVGPLQSNGSREVLAPPPPEE